jgi:hypothetical protein
MVIVALVHDFLRSIEMVTLSANGKTCSYNLKRWKVGTLSIKEIAIHHLPEITPIEVQIITNNDGWPLVMDRLEDPRYGTYKNEFRAL